MFNEDPFTDWTTQVGEKVLESISQEHRKSWETLIESTDIPQNSKKAWFIIRKLCRHPREPVQKPKVTANQVATQLLLNCKNGKMRHEIKPNRKKYNRNPDHTRPLSMEELEVSLSSLKTRKANSPDDISAEQIQHLGSGTKKWLLKLYNYCLSTHKLPKIWKKAHVLALLKPGRDAAIPKNFRPISFLCHTFKLFK